MRVTDGNRGLRTAASLALVAAVLAGCGGGAATPTSTPTTRAGGAAQAAVDPAQLFCQGSGGTVIARVSGGRRADLCRLPGGRTVSTADLINSHNNL